jgi:phosphate transport system permease protein
VTEGTAARGKLPNMTATVTPPETAAGPPASPPPPLERTSYGDRVFRGLLTVGAVAVPVLLGLLVYQLWTGSALAISRFGLGFLTSSTWDPVAEKFGAYPLIFGTLISSFIALLIAVPLSLGVAIFLTEFAPKAIRQPIAFLIGLLAAIPSVVYGLWGIFVLVPLLRTSLFPFLRETLGFLPLFQGPIYGPSMLAAGIILAIMVMPYVMSVSREVLLAVPDTQREAALALGATRWEAVITTILPYARSGIIGAIILGLGRALGETMAVTMLIGNRHEISSSLFAPGYTMAAAIANEFSEAVGDLHLSALAYVAFLLFVVTVVVNAGARLLIWRVARGSGAGSQAL